LFSFGYNVGNATVVIGTRICTVLNVAHTSLICTVPAGAGIALTVRATIGGQLSTTKTFSYSAPIITGVTGCIVQSGAVTSKCSILGETTITIIGTK
jgi:hypothetical protein